MEQYFYNRKKLSSKGLQAWGGPRPYDLSPVLISRKNNLTAIMSDSSTIPENLHHWSILWDLTAIAHSHAPTITSTNSSKAHDKVVFGMLHVAHWVELHAFGRKLVPALKARDKPFTALLSELKEFSLFFITLSHPFSKITHLHVLTWYVSISAFDRSSPLSVVWTNWWLPHHLMQWHYLEPLTLSWVTTCPTDVGIDFWA